MSRKAVVLVSSLALITVLCAGTQTAAAGRPLEGQRYVTLRALADHLAETAKGALEAVDDEARRGNTSAARLVSTALSFARDAHEFHRSLSHYRSLPFDVPARLADLATAARQASDGIRAGRGMEASYDDWSAMLDVLERMKLLLDGRDVAVPAPHVVRALAGTRLHEFQMLAVELATSAARAHDGAKRSVGEYPERGPQFLGELRHFAIQARGLGQRSRGEVNPQQIGPVVDRLLEDARGADRRMRDARVFRTVWDDSGNSISLLQRMASLVRS